MTTTVITESPLQSDSPDWLETLTEDMEDAADMEDDPDPSQIAASMAPEQRHLITTKRRPEDTEYIEVLKTLTEHGCLSTDNMEMHTKGAMSFDDDVATVQAIVIASLEQFIYKQLQAYCEQPEQE